MGMGVLALSDYLGKHLVEVHTKGVASVICHGGSMQWVVWFMNSMLVK